ncbi:hypothetical protein ACFE04_023614 [Oxalis oulophora]
MAHDVVLASWRAAKAHLVAPVKAAAGSRKEASSSSDPIQISNPPCGRDIEKSREVRIDSDGRETASQIALSLGDHDKEKRKRLDTSDEICLREGPRTRRMIFNESARILENGPKNVNGPEIVGLVT